MSEASAGPTIILIGGEVTLDSGAQLDTRRPLADDEWDFTLRGALGGSEAFWHTAKSVTDVILGQDDSHDPWALAWVNKTIKRPRADGTFTRVRTVKYLDDADQLMDLQEHPTDATNAHARYRIMPYSLRFEDVRSVSDPAVFVGAFHTTYEEGWDILGPAPLTLVLSKWPQAVLVLPHTPLIEDKARQLLAWHRKGAEPPSRDWGDSLELEEDHDSGESQRFVARASAEKQRFVAAYEAAEDKRTADPYVIDDDVRISFWADRGEIKDAADLDAAFRFVMSRYDLDFGLWDLARDRVLRESLLQPEDLAPVPDTPAAIPSELAAITAERVAERDKARATETAAREALHEVVWPRLEQLGWHVPTWKEPGTVYNLAVGPELEPPYPNVETSPAVFFSLTIFKKQAVLKLFAMTRIKATEDFLGLHVDDVEQATGQRPEAGKNTVLRLPGRGWGGSLDGWAADLELALGCVDLLRPNLAPVIDAAIEFHESQREGLGPLDVTITVAPDPPHSVRPKRSLLKRLLDGK